MSNEEQVQNVPEQTQQSPAPDLTEQLAAAQAEADQLKDKYLRSVAEFANYRKRQDRDAQAQALRIKAGAYQNLLPILDDLRRALQHAPDGAAGQAWFEGVVQIERKFVNLLERDGIKPIVAVGQPFDPRLHFAVSQEASDTEPEGYVIREERAGFMLEDEVLRAAVVVVSSGPAAAKEA